MTSTTKKNVDLSTTVAGISLPTCLYNASGPRSGTATALHKVATSQSGAVLTKSATLESQTGNPQPRTWHSEDGLASLNSEGLPNNGIDYYISAETYDEAMEGVGTTKPFMVSLSGKTLADNLKMLDKIANSPIKDKIASIELNLACPNVIGKPIIAYDADQMNDILTEIGKKAAKLPPLGVKMPPFLDMQHFQTAAKILNKHKKTVKYIATINTIGNATAIDLLSQAPVISSNQGFAGLSGPAVKYTALANVRQFRQLLDAEIDVVGVGGITTGQDVLEFLLAGATACQIATVHWKEGPLAFDRILTELSDCLVEHGYTSVAGACGQLQAWSKDGAATARQKRKEILAGTNSTKSTSMSAGGGGEDATLYKTLCAILVVLVAILLSDKFLIN